MSPLLHETLCLPACLFSLLRACVQFEELSSEGEQPSDAVAATDESAGGGGGPYERTDVVMQSLTLAGSYKEKTGEKLLEGE